MKKKYFKTICSTLIVGAFLFLAFGSDDSKNSSSSSSQSNYETPKATKPCCVCSSTGKERTNSGYRTCGTCYGIGKLTDGRHSQVCQ